MPGLTPGRHSANSNVGQVLGYGKARQALHDPDYETASFSAAEKAALRLADQLLLTNPDGVLSQSLYQDLKKYFSDGGGISVLNTDEFDDYAHTVGRTTFRTEVQVVDNRDRPVQAGETGRLRYRGPGVARRFIDGDGKEEAINQEGWFYPGDLAAKLDLPQDQRTPS